ncbi:MAG: TIGR03936 family radical SAM-associated protein [Hyphomicrobiales bacterium]
MSTQRFRVWFRKGARVRYISHLDVLRYWERAIRRAGLPLSYSQGFTPHPKLAFAGPLPLGFTADCEVMDVTLDERVSASEFRDRLARETTPDLALVDVAEVAPASPPPQALVTWADYRVELPGVDAATAATVVGEFLAKTDVPWSEERKEKVRTYNLRAAVASLRAEPAEGGTRLQMRLQADQELMARPEQVVAALFPGTEPAEICRAGLVLNESSPARDAWRRQGRFQ